MLMYDCSYMTILHIPQCSDCVTFQLDSCLSVELMSECFTVMISTSQQLEIRCHRKDSILPIRCQPQRVKGKLNFIGLAWVLALSN